MLAVLVVAVGIAAAGLVSATTAAVDAGGDAEVEQIAASLRCPTCQGLSVADSPSQLAQGMRDIIDRQLDAGRSPAEVRDWFVGRYGPWILLEPPATGVGALVWLLPVGVLALGVVLAWKRTRSTTAAAAATDSNEGVRPRGPAWAALWAVFAIVIAGGLATNVAARGDRGVLTGAGGAPAAPADAAPPPVRALRQATVDQPDDQHAWLALATALDERGDLAASLRPYRRALTLADDDPAVQRAAASAFIRADQPADAEPLLRELATRFADDAEVLLLLGTAERALGRFSATTTLQRFLQVAPDHPAANSVRAVLDDERDP